MLEGKQGTAHAAIPVRQENPAGCAADASWKTAISSQAPATRQTAEGIYSSLFPALRALHVGVSPVMLCTARCWQSHAS